MGNNQNKGFFSSLLSAAGDGLISGVTGGVGSAVSGLFGIGQSFLNNHFQKEAEKRQFDYQTKLNQQQQDNTLAQMAQSQDYNKENMALQNEYQIAAENRANAYNSVGAQIERAEAAGVSPLAALGQGGAGGMMSVSSAPSSSTPSPSGANAGHIATQNGMAALMQNSAQMAQIGANIALQAEQQENTATNTESQRKDVERKEIENRYLEAKEIASLSIQRLTASNLKLDAEIKHYQAQVAEITAANEPEKQRLALLHSLRSIAEINQRIWESNELTPGRKSQLESEVANLNQQVLTSAAQASLFGAQATLTQKQAETEGYRALVMMSEFDRVNALADLGFEQAEAQRIANEFDKAHNEFKKEHFKSDKRWERAASALNMAQGVVSSVCGAVGCAMSAGLIQPPSVTVETSENVYNGKGKLIGEKHISSVTTKKK